MKKVLRSADELNQLLRRLNQMGYDRVQLPGGTSKDGNHYAGIIVYYYDEEKDNVHFVGLPYDADFHVTGDENGHTKKFGEHPLETIIRELFEETGLKAEPEDLELVFSRSINDNRPGRQGQKHIKYFYMVDLNKCKGELFDFEGPNPIDGETSAPLLFPAAFFKEILYKGHMQPFEIAVTKLKEKDTGFGYALMNL